MVPYDFVGAGDPFFLFPPALLPGNNHCCFRHNSTFKSFETRLPRGRLRPLNQPEEDHRDQAATSGAMFAYGRQSFYGSKFGELIISGRRH